MNRSVIWMFTGSVVIGFFITSSLLVNDINDIESSQTKIYTAVWMALWMVILELMMHSSTSIYWWSITIFLIVLVGYLARKQIAVDDNQYLKAMIQHHSSAILTSDRILEKSDDPHVRKLARWISDSQKSEISLMNRLLKR